MVRVLTCLTDQHDWRFVLVAGLTCFLASVTAISLYRRAGAASGYARLARIGGAGVAAGGGIWATHFLAMLAYQPGVAVAYELSLTLLSVAAAVLVTATGLAIAVLAARPWAALVGGGVIGGGVAGMHYLGMWAVELPGELQWSPDLVLASVVLGIALGAAALHVAARWSGRAGLLVGATLLVLSIVSLHFTAMGAVSIVADPARVVSPLSLPPSVLALAVGGIAVLVLCIGLMSAFVDSRLDQQGFLYSTAINNMTQGLVMFDADERVVLCNQRYIEMYGLSPEVVKPGAALIDVIRHRFETGSIARDPEEYRTEILAAMADGRTVRNVVISPDGRAIAVVNRPISGGKFWLGTHADVTERHQAEQRAASLLEREQRRAEVEEAIAAFRQSVDALLRTVAESAATTGATAKTMWNSAGETAERATSAVHTSNEASVNVSAASAAAVQLSSSIEEISRQLSQATALVGTAVTEAHATNTDIAGLTQAAQEIGEVVNLIRQIAGQTNLLALNATIEAARAGEAGKGFAVVASEVKSLAVQTANATEQIAAQIAAVQASTANAVEAIRRNAERMQEINRCTNAVAASLQQQNAATGEISQNVASAAQATRSVVEVLDAVADAVGKARGSADTVLSASEAVENAARDLRASVDAFLAKVAA